MPRIQSALKGVVPAIPFAYRGISNNQAERSIKPFVIDRKNFLFANTPRGAQASAAIFSLIGTAKENGLNPYDYLVYIFSNAPQWADALPMHISKSLPDTFAAAR